MRKSDAAFGAATRVSLDNRRRNAPAELVCLALVLAIAALVFRIVAIW
jgi:hypothetical protein